MSACLAVVLAASCGDDSATPADGSAPDATATDAPVSDAGHDSATDGSGSQPDSTVSEGGGSDATMNDGSSDGAADGGSDGSTADAPSDAPNDAPGEGGDASNEGGNAGVSTLWLGGNISVSGVTSDGQVIYYDRSSQTYYARPVSGGTSTLLYTVPTSAAGSYTVLVGKVVFIFGWGNHYLGTLTMWSSQDTQPVTLSSANALAYLYQTTWASDDSRHVVYLEITDQPNNVSSIYGANADGTGVTLLASNVDTRPWATGCFPRAVLRGPYAVVSYCTAADAGAVPLIKSFAMENGWAPAVVTTNWINSYRANIENFDPSAFPFAVDPDAGMVVAASSSSYDGGLQVFPIDGGAGTLLDPTWKLDPTLSFAGSKSNPWFVYYNTDAGVLRQTPVPNTAPQTLIDGGVNYFDAFSRDGKWILASSQLHQAAFFADISVVSTVTPGAGQLIAKTTQYGGLPISMSGRPNNAFTTDQQYAIVYTDLVTNNENNWTFHVRSATVTPPLSMALLSSGYAVDSRSLQSSKVLVLDNFVDSDGGSGPVSVDLHIADPSSSAAATLVASGVPGTYDVTSDLSTIVYTVTKGSMPGIYTYVVP